MQKQTGKWIGYARVSTEDQELRLQVDALHKAGCWNIWKEHRSATRGTRPQLELAIADLRPGDVFVVWKLDRLGRNLRQLYHFIDRIHAAGARFKSLTEGIDYTTPMGELMFAQMGAWAQFEASMTALRTGAGMAAMRARGAKHGAKPKLTKQQAAALVKMRKAGLTKVKIARQFKISTGSVNNYMRRAEAAKAKRKRK